MKKIEYKKITSHLNKDAKEFRKQIREDVDLKKSLMKKKVKK